MQLQGRPAADKTEEAVAAQQIGEGRRRCRGKKEGETRSIVQAQRAQTQGGFQKVSPESASADFLVLTCLDSTHTYYKNHVNHSHSASTLRAALPARACDARLRPTATATAPAADDPTDTPPRRDPHDLLACRSATPFPVDQPHKQAREPLGHDARRHDEQTPSHTQLTGSQD